MKARRILIKIIKLAAGTVVSVVALLLLVAALLYLPPLQRYAVGKATQYASQATGYRIELGALHLYFPLTLSLRELCVSDSTAHSDTLLYVKNLGAGVKLLPLLRSQVEVNFIELNGLQVASGDLIEGMQINGSLGHFRLSVRNADLAREQLQATRLLLSDARLHLHLTRAASDSLPADSAAPPPAWEIGLRNARIKNVDFTLTTQGDSSRMHAAVGQMQARSLYAGLAEGRYSAGSVTVEQAEFAYDADDSPPAEGLDTRHIAVSDFNLGIKSVLYSPHDVRLQLTRLALSERSGVGIEEGSASIAADSSRIELNSLAISSYGGSYIRGKMELPLQRDNRQELRLSTGSTAKIEAAVSRTDALTLAPAQSELLGSLPNPLLTLALQASGNLSRIVLNELKAQVPGLAQISADGIALQPTDSTRRDIQLALQAAASLPQNDEEGERRTLNLSVRGDARLLKNEASASLHLATDSGTVELNGQYHLLHQNYSLQASSHALSLANLLPGLPLRGLYLKIEADGRGTDLYAPRTQANVHTFIARGNYNGIDVGQLCLGAGLINQNATLSVESDNPLLPIEGDGHATLKGDTLKARLDLRIDRADLQQLQLSEIPLTAGGNLRMRASTDFKESYNISLKATELLLKTPKKEFHPDSISLRASTNADSTRLRLRQGDLRANVVAWEQVEKLAAHYAKAAEVALHKIEEGDTTLTLPRFTRMLPRCYLSVECGQKNIAHNFVNFLGYDFDRFSFTGSTDATKGLDVESHLYGLRSDSLQLDTIRFFVRQDTSAIKYYGGVRSTSPIAGREKESFGAFVNGGIERDSLSLNFLLIDRNKEVSTRLGVGARLLPRGIEARFNPQAMLLGSPFTFNDDNHITYHKDKPLLADVKFYDERRSGFYLYAQPDSGVAQDIGLEVSNINLEELTSGIPFVPDLGGTLESDFHFVQREFTTLGCDLHISDFSYEHYPIGDEAAELIYLPKEDGSHYVECATYHNQQQVLSLTGNYRQGQKKGDDLLEADVELDRFPLKPLNAFMSGLPAQLGGYLSGSLTAEGAPASPRLDGAVQFDSVRVSVPSFGGDFHFKEGERIEIKESQMKLDNLSIYAKGTTPFSISGDVNLKELSDPQLSLTMKADGYELLSARRSKGSIIYGKLFIDLNARLSGSVNSLNMSGSLTIDDNTDITYVMDGSPLEVNNEVENIITFTNFSDTTRIDRYGDEEEEEAQAYDLGNMNVNLSITIEEGARLNADLDPNRSSYVELVGGGRLNFSYSSLQGMTLGGRYNLSDGELRYNMPLIPLKTFKIKEGSYVSWNGDIASPTLNLTATENITTSVEIDDASRPVNFEVGVEITNTLDDMGLNFILSAPNDAAMQSQLNALSHEEETQYAVAMLVTGVYLGDGGKLSAGNALSSYLQSQIDNIAQNALGGVNVNVGMSSGEDSQTGDSYTDYTFSFAKRFWNDRITVVIGGSVSDNQNRSQEETFIDNVSIEWRLDNSGNRYLKLFYDKNYESVLEGEITEAGAGYVWRRQLKKLSNPLLLLRRKKREATPGATEKKREE